MPRINGYYYAVIQHLVRRTTWQGTRGWIEARVAAPTRLNGEIGELHGVCFIET